MVKMQSNVGDTSSENRRAPLPGWYHLVVTAFDPYPTKKDGSAIQAWKVSCGVCDGPPSPAGECQFKGKDIDIMFFHPKRPDDFSKKKQDRLLVCLGLVPPDNQREAGKEYE